ncbi:MAG: alpha/beta hydrolase [Methyloligellaceae bacterium]
MLKKWSLRFGLAAIVLFGVSYALYYSGLLTVSSVQRVLSTIVSESGVTIEHGLAYGSHPRHKLDIYRPDDDKGSGPIVIFLYGGGWKAGHRDSYGFVGAALASRGMTTVVPDYRLYPEVSFPAFVADAALAYSWVWRRLNAKRQDPRPIVLLGHSAGAHIAALLAFNADYLKGVNAKASRPAAFVGLAGPYAFDPTTWPTTKEIFATVADADRARPIAFVSSAAPPSLLIHGLEDTVVRLWNTRSMAKALKDAGIKTRKVEYENIGHIGVIAAISRPFRWRASVLKDVVTFIRDVTQ